MADPPVPEIAEEQLHVSESEKLLGIHLDKTMSWASHVEAVIKQCNSLLFLLNRIKQYLSLPIRKLFYNAYILPHLDYCCTIWENPNNELLNSNKIPKMRSKVSSGQTDQYCIQWNVCWTKLDDLPREGQLSKGGIDVQNNAWPDTILFALSFSIYQWNS